jgi:hypothetical protein
MFLIMDGLKRKNLYHLIQLELIAIIMKVVLVQIMNRIKMITWYKNYKNRLNNYRIKKNNKIKVIKKS